jgi:AraC-like DNA-binding protein
MAESVTPRFDEFGLSTFSFEYPAGGAGRAQPHTHLELELVSVQTGAVTLAHAGSQEEIGAHELVSYWAGLPHAVYEVRPGSVFRVAQVPIVDVLGWAGSTASIDQLLAGRLLRQPLTADEVAADRLSFARWSADLGTGDVRLHAIAGQEMQARLRRFLHATTRTSRGPVERPGSPTASGVTSAIRYVLRHFMVPITVDDVATATGWQRDHLMASFRRVCGLTLWNFVTRVRLAEAQRLLATTELPMLAICGRAGFSSTSRMYATFHRYCDRTPAEYRHASRG